MQVLRAAAATLTATFDAPPGATAVTVTRLDGTALYSAQPATLSGNAASFPLTPADTALLDTLTATFVSANQGTLAVAAEVVGALLFTLAEARAFDKGQLADAGVYRDAAIVAAREAILDDFQRICRVAFVPRYRVLQLDGDGSRDIQLWDTRVSRVRYAAMRYRGQQAFTPLTTEDLADLFISPGGTVAWDSRGWWWPGQSNIRIGYEYGYAQPPGPVKHAALIVALSQLVATNINQRTMSFSQENGQTFRYATPGVGRFSPYGLPEADAILERYADPLLEVG